MAQVSLPVLSKRLCLRRLGESDLTAFMAYRGDPEVARFQDWRAMSEADTQGFLRAMACVELLQVGKWTQLGIATRDGTHLLGDVGIRMHEDGRGAELGITLSAQAQGRGQGEEAVRLVCDWLWQRDDLDVIEAITLTQNVSALALLQRLPFEHVRQTTEVEDGVEYVEEWFEWRRS